MQVTTTKKKKKKKEKKAWRRQFSLQTRKSGSIRTVKEKKGTKMPEGSTQPEVMDTHRSVYTQCGALSGVVASVIVELTRIKELKTQAREINTKRRKKPIRKKGMKVSAAQTEKIRGSGYRKETMTELQKEESEEEVVVLKVISNIERTSNAARQARNGEN